MKNQFKYLLIAIRPAQWIKNLFIFAALIFSGNIFQPVLLFKTIQTFVLFCLLTSGVYLINDIVDFKADQLHPEKSKRPIASGKLKISFATAVAILLTLVSIIGAFLINQIVPPNGGSLPGGIGTIFAFYFILFLAYPFYLKHIVILDVFVIALGFVLRVIVGAEAISVPISHWLLICTMFLALFLGFAKRRHELLVLRENSDRHRKSLAEYSQVFLDQMIGVATASIVLSYALYTTSAETISRLGTKNLIYTVPFVLYGIFRYLYLIYQKDKGGSPTELIVSDKPFLINLFFWILVVIFLLYGKNWL